MRLKKLGICSKGSSGHQVINSLKGTSLRADTESLFPRSGLLSSPSVTADSGVKPTSSSSSWRSNLWPPNSTRAFPPDESKREPTYFPTIPPCPNIRPVEDELLSLLLSDGKASPSVPVYFLLTPCPDSPSLLPSECESYAISRAVPPSMPSSLSIPALLGLLPYPFFLGNYYSWASEWKNLELAHLTQREGEEISEQVLGLRWNPLKDLLV